MKQSIFEILRQGIVEGELAPGARLVEADLARQFGTSKTPVREALLMLERERLVEAIPHVGAQVTPLTSAEFDELMLIRYALEFAVLDEIIAKVTPEMLQRAESALDAMRRAYGTSSLRQYRVAERTLHEEIVRAAGRPTLAEMLLSLDDRLDRYFLTLVRMDRELWAHDLELNERRLEAARSGRVRVLTDAIGSWKARLASFSAGAPPTDSSPGRTG